MELHQSLGTQRHFYNTETKELVTYHWDTQKGVGEKYNITFGMDISESKRKIKETENDLPGYSYYKRFFEMCDNFNRSLHDRHWPYKRGSKGHPGDLGKFHDFCMAVVIRNTVNAWNSLSEKGPRDTDFCQQMTDLANDIYRYLTYEMPLDKGFI